MHPFCKPLLASHGWMAQSGVRDPEGGKSVVCAEAYCDWDGVRVQIEELLDPSPPDRDGLPPERSVRVELVPPWVKGYRVPREGEGCTSEVLRKDFPDHCCRRFTIELGGLRHLVASLWSERSPGVLPVGNENLKRAEGNSRKSCTTIARRFSYKKESTLMRITVTKEHQQVVRRFWCRVWVPEASRHRLIDQRENELLQAAPLIHDPILTLSELTINLSGGSTCR